MRAAAVAGATGMADPYERLKELTRGKKVTPEGMREFISGLGMPDDVEARLLALTPANYTGLPPSSSPTWTTESPAGRSTDGAGTVGRAAALHGHSWSLIDTFEPFIDTLRLFMDT